MNNNSNSSLQLASNIVTISLAGVSAIACIIALGALLYYKLWHKFVYRLMLYTFVPLIVLSSSIIMQASFLLITNTNGTAIVISGAIVNGSALSAVIFVICTNISVYLMALHNYQFTYKADLWLLIPSMLLTLSVTTVELFFLDEIEKHFLVIAVILCGILFFVNIIITLLTLVPMCGRACGYNICMKATIATKESHRKALKEVLPLYILILPSFFLSFLTILNLSVSLDYLFIFFVYRNLTCSTPGLVSALSFALHLCFIRKKLKNLRGKKRPVCYEMDNSHRTRHTTAYTSEGISETCNTEYQYVSENELDTQFLNQKNNLVL